MAKLLEYKLRRYCLLGQDFNCYIPPPIRNTSWSTKHNDEYVTGVRIIKKIIMKNKEEEINHIVPTILKVNLYCQLYNFCLFLMVFL